jgi:hypothetical protein
MALELADCRRVTQDGVNIIADYLTQLTRLSVANCFHVGTAAIARVAHRLASELRHWRRRRRRRHPLHCAMYTCTSCRLWSLQQFDVGGLDAVHDAVFLFDRATDGRPLARKSMLRSLQVGEVQRLRRRMQRLACDPVWRWRRCGLRGVVSRRRCWT